MLFELLQKGDTIRRIDSSKDLLDYLALGYQTASGMTVTTEQAARFAPVYSCIRVLQESVGQLPFNLFKTSGTSRKKAENHDIQRLLVNGPNDFMTTQEWVEVLIAHLCLAGNHYSFIRRSVLGTPIELLPLNPHSVEPKLDPDFKLVYVVRFANGTSDVLEPRDIFHVRLGSKDNVLGMSPIQQSRESIGLGMATQDHGARLFRNGARPGGLLSAPGNVTVEQIKDIRENWNSTQGGNENAHKIAILAGGLTWSSIGMTSDDAQFLETRKFQRSEIAGIFRVPPHMIGDLEKATFSNIEHQSIDFVVYSLVPLLRRIELRGAKSLLSDRDKKSHFFKFNVNSLLRGDMKTRGEFYNKMVQNGAYSPNEIREFEDMDPRNGGDIYLTPMNMAINGKPIGEENAND